MHLHALWNDLWPNMVAPNAWTIAAVALHLAVSMVQRQRLHNDMKQHVTATTGGADGNGD